MLPLLGEIVVLVLAVGLVILAATPFLRRRL